MLQRLPPGGRGNFFASSRVTVRRKRGERKGQMLRIPFPTWRARWEPFVRAAYGRLRYTESPMHTPHPIAGCTGPIKAHSRLAKKITRPRKKQRSGARLERPIADYITSISFHRGPRGKRSFAVCTDRHENNNPIEGLHGCEAGYLIQCLKSYLIV